MKKLAIADLPLAFQGLVQPYSFGVEVTGLVRTYWPKCYGRSSADPFTMYSYSAMPFAVPVVQKLGRMSTGMVSTLPSRYASDPAAVLGWWVCWLCA